MQNNLKQSATEAIKGLSISERARLSVKSFSRAQDINSLIEYLEKLEKEGNKEARAIKAFIEASEIIETLTIIESACNPKNDTDERREI